MYKNYKIGPDGTPKYNGTIYRIAPERRSSKNTEEWERRLNTDPRKLRRRKKQQQEIKFTLKVKHVVYAIILIIFIGILNMFETSNVSTSNNNQSVNITLDNVVRDFGNEFIKPSNGNLFLHVSLNFENTLNETNYIDISKLFLIDQYNNKINISSIDNNTGDMTLDLYKNSNIIKNITFEIPKSYKGQMDLIFENGNSYNNNIAKFNIE